MKLKLSILADHSGQNRAHELAKVPTSRSRSKTAVSFAAAENNEPAEAKNSKDTVMSRVDRRDVEGERGRGSLVRGEEEEDERRTAEGCVARVVERHKERKLGRGYKGTSNQLTAVDERDFGFLLSIDRKEETIFLF